MLKQPVGFVKLTNIALIKYKANGKRFEIACYKNKVLNWRNGVESNLAEVLQSDDIYVNAAQGEVAKKTLLEECFPDKTKKEILMLILDKGEMQVSQKEREVLMETLTNDILNIISAKIIHPKTKRVFSIDTIRAAVKESNIAFNLSKSAKKQAMDAIKVLCHRYFVEKVGMLVKAVFDDPEVLTTASKVAEFEVRSKSDKEAVVLVTHEKFVELEKLAEEKFKDRLFLTVLDPNFIEKEILSIDYSADALMHPRIDPALIDSKSKKVPKKGYTAPKVDLTDVQEEVKRETIANHNNATLATMMDEKEHQAKVCHTCKDITFAIVNDYKDHIKSELHKFNLQRKMKNDPPLDFEEFQNHLLMQDFVNKKKGKK